MRINWYAVFGLVILFVLTMLQDLCPAAST
jgi:hypothetical protein